jgi:hypothetical protein
MFAPKTSHKLVFAICGVNFQVPIDLRCCKRFWNILNFASKSKGVISLRLTEETHVLWKLLQNQYFMSVHIITTCLDVTVHYFLSILKYIKFRLKIQMSIHFYWKHMFAVKNGPKSVLHGCEAHIPSVLDVIVL